MGAAAALGEAAAEPPVPIEPIEPIEAREPPALLEAIDRDGLVRQAWRIERWPFSIGRALDNDVVLSDPHVAPHHATLDLARGAAGAATVTVN
ncbi:MAG TPA: FHA domain-containing protein, partial [Caldimonas sp.]